MALVISQRASIGLTDPAVPGFTFDPLFVVTEEPKVFPEQTVVEVVVASNTDVTLPRQSALDAVTFNIEWTDRVLRYMGTRPADLEAKFPSFKEEIEVKPATIEGTFTYDDLDAVTHNLKTEINRTDKTVKYFADPASSRLLFNQHRLRLQRIRALIALSFTYDP